MQAYEIVFDAIIEEFTIDVFGPYSNAIDSDSFQEFLGFVGWKYFDLKNLNSLFAIKYQEKVGCDEIEALADIEEHESNLEDSLFFE